MAHVSTGRDAPASFVVSHHTSLDDAPEAYELFKHEQDNCTKIVLKP